MSNSVSGNPEQECDTNPELWECELDGIIVTPEDYWMDDPFFDPESVSEEDDGGGLYPPQPEDTECHVFYGCGGGGGPGPVPEEDDDLDFFGEINIDPSVINNPKVHCVLDRLLNDGNTLSDIIVKFADESVGFDLNIEVGEVDNNDPGVLISSGSSNIFTLRIDKSRAQDRLPIQIATTLMHEVIHAEMRRFLYAVPDSSTLPGFPGSFAEDWEAYVRSHNGKNLNEQVGIAEHNAMAEKYIDLMASGLREFDNFSLTADEYKALSWEGLIGTEAWSNVDQIQIGLDYQSAINSSDSSCN